MIKDRVAISLERNINKKYRNKKEIGIPREYENKHEETKKRYIQVAYVYRKNIVQLTT